jgi:hypothetical protein
LTGREACLIRATVRAFPGRLPNSAASFSSRIVLLRVFRSFPFRFRFFRPAFSGSFAAHGAKRVRFFAKTI